MKRWHIDLEVDLPDNLKPGAIDWKATPEVLGARLLGFGGPMIPPGEPQTVYPQGFDAAQVKGL
jgi:hypothetical protein